MANALRFNGKRLRLVGNNLLWSGSVPLPLVFRVKTDNPGVSNSLSFTIPTRPGYAYNYTVSWGDGTVDMGVTGNITHTYDTAGEKTIKIYGIFSQFYFNNSGDRLKLLSIDAWGNVQYSSNNNMERSFFGASNLYYISDGASWFDSLTNGYNMFYGNNLTSLPEGMTLDILTSGSGMFYNNNLTYLPDGMTLSNLTNGSFMFFSNNLTSLPEGMTLSSLTNGSAMFYGNTINTARYSQLLIDMEASNPNNNVTFHGGNSKYNSSAVTARANLVARGWTITDGGLE